MFASGYREAIAKDGMHQELYRDSFHDTAAVSCSLYTMEASSTTFPFNQDAGNIDFHLKYPFFLVYLNLIRLHLEHIFISLSKIHNVEEHTNKCFKLF